MARKKKSGSFVLQPWLIYLGLALLVLAVFWPVIHYPFINLDNQEYIIENPVMHQPFSWTSFRWSFTAMRTGDWQPMIWLSFFLDRALFGLDPSGFHSTNVLLHILNALLIFWVFSKATGRVGASAVVAALFAVHPLRVESVAWIAERKDVLSGLFWWLTIGTYLESRRKKSTPHYWGSVLFYVLAVLSKPMVVSLPLVLFLFDFWPLGRFRPGVSLWKLTAEKIPFFGLAVFSSIMTLKAHKVIGAIISLKDISFFDRAVNAVVSCYLYLQKTVWPFGLAIAYPFPNPQTEMPIFVVACLIGLAVFTFWAWKKKDEMPFLLFGWLWYLITVGPVLGLVHISAQAMADRYMYLPHIGIAVMAVWGFLELVPPEKIRTAGTAVFAGTLVFFSLVTVRQLGFWSSPLALNKHAVEVVPGNYFAYGGLGYSYLKKGDLDKALDAYEKALKLHRTARTLFNVGSIYVAKGNYQQAEPYFQEALKLNPRSVFANHNLGLIYLMRKDEERALKHMQIAARHERQTSRARVALADFYLMHGETERAEALVRALRISFPGSGRVLFLRARILQLSGDKEGAVELYQRAVWATPRSYRAIDALSLIWMLDEQWIKARDFLTEVVNSEPAYLPAYLNLANALMGLEDYDEAIRRLNQVLAMNPKSAPAQRILKSAQKAKKQKEAGLAPVKLEPGSGIDVSSPAEFRNLMQVLTPSTSQN